LNDNPLEKIADWLNEALTKSTRRNPLAMALATCSPQGRPAVRMVLARGYCRSTGHVVFYTNFQSRKASELDATGSAAAVLYWEEFGGRQLRIEGPVTRAPDAQADAYFAQRAAGSQLNAWVSQQSRPLASAASLSAEAEARAAHFGLDSANLDLDRPADIPRPEHWGGYRLWIEKVEFWSEGAGRFHERLLYSRSATAASQPGGTDNDWQLTRLQP
jgi:pyridoxamine 5'-phosphate oxidase